MGFESFPSATRSRTSPSIALLGEGLPEVADGTIALTTAGVAWMNQASSR
ncbi:hypothetical protein I41_27970 [Lacipirellula limnantheis]|uniref:Uncharacterized protein n=1 Tax=Lacipirellula limnantheis TaxID=2528024 RepID=A0A517TZ10_9BACT|nr:hypothetical protein I41_27970 [Lacipirellula limnantheis]